MSYSDETEFVSPIDLQLVQDSDQESDDEFDQSSDSESEYYSVSDSDDDSPSKRYGSIKVSLIKDEIKNQQVDVIVNSTSSSLELTKGAASRALLKAAGDTIQKECKDKYPNGISDTSIAVTGGGNLQCAKVYHVSLQKWRGDASKGALEKLIMKCLNEASSANQRSIALPALGTGMLSYDRSLVAKCMFRCVKHFERDNPSTKLQDVRFVIYPDDTASYQAFERRVKRKEDSNDEPTKLVESAKVGEIVVKLVTGSLINQGCQVVMTTSTRKLELSKGALSQSVLEAAGSSLQTECSSKYANGIQHGEIAVLSTGNVSCEKIFCGALPRYDKPPDGPENPSQLLTKIVTASLKEASKDNLTSVCFPTLGTGHLKYPPDVSASLMFGAIKNFAVNNGNSALRTVIIVIHSTSTSTLLQPFQSKHKEIITAPEIPVPIRGSKPMVLPRPKPAARSKRLSNESKEIIKKHFSSEQPSSSKLPLRIVPISPVIQKPRILSDEEDENAIRATPVSKKLSKIDIDIIGKALRKPVSAKQRSSTKMPPGAEPILPGIPKRRSIPTQSVTDEEDKDDTRAAAVPPRNTPDFCMHMYQLEISPPHYWTVYTNDKSIKQWIIKESGKGGYRCTAVTGSVFKSIAKLVDSTWNQAKVGHGRDAKGLSELGYSSVKVTKVQRIENLKVYESYRQKQQDLFHKAGEEQLFEKLSVMESKFGDPMTVTKLDDTMRTSLYEEVNEGYFFHGTKQENVEGVMKNGIDPRLAHQHAVFGQGIYMAESSTKADQYTDERGDSSRKRENLQMFLVRCSLGKICLMKNVEKFRRPPCYVPDCLSDKCSHNKRYDSIVEEEKYIFREFVVYESSQAYPEYLITYDRV